MQAQVRSIEANDITDWPRWLPCGPADEFQWFTVSIGPVGEPGSDLFQVAVATPLGLRERCHRGRFVGLMVDRFEPQVVEDAIRKFVSGCHPSTWQEVVDLLSNHMRWEYDGYRG